MADDVWIGRIPSPRDLAGTSYAGIVDLSAELGLPASATPRAIVPVLDLTAPDTLQLTAAAQAIEAMRKSGPVLVCCALGFSRSASAVIAWLVATGRSASVESAIAQVRGAKRHIVLRDAHTAALRGLPGWRS